jgi:hypothetical protein
MTASRGYHVFLEPDARLLLVGEALFETVESPNSDDSPANS